MAAPLPLPKITTSGATLTVGAGMMFATIRDAVSAAKDGDTVAVKAGTYTNEFVGYVTKKITMVGVGGMVHMVATHGSPEGKAFIVPQTDFTIRNFEFSGITEGSQYGNLAGIRSEGGNLTVQYCFFHDNQNGLLANPTATGQNTITVENSEFARNGTGTGFTHNLYTGAFAQGIFRNNYFHDAKVGHELKSRALSNLIEGNVIANRSGSASYDIDLPNGGVAVIRNNIIEKGPNAANVAMIHYGGEFQFKWARNSLTVTGNTLINDMDPTKAIGILNHAPLNGLSVTPDLSGNTQYGLAANRLLLTAGATYRDLTPTSLGQAAVATATTPPALPTPTTWAAAPFIPIPSGPQRLSLTNGGHSVTGGAELLTVTDTSGGNSISGGTGGMVLNATGGGDIISTRAGSANTLVVAAARSTIVSNGDDRIDISGIYVATTINGDATVNSTSFDTFRVNGTAVINAITPGEATISATGSAVINSSTAFFTVVKENGASVAMSGGPTVTGGAAGIFIQAGGSGSRVTAQDGTGLTVTAATANITLTGGAGDDVVNLGSGGASIIAGSGSDTVNFGSGAATVQSGLGADLYSFQAGLGGRATISGFRDGEDRLDFKGFSGDPVATRSFSGGSTLLTLDDGTRIQLVGVILT